MAGCSCSGPRPARDDDDSIKDLSEEDIARFGSECDAGYACADCGADLYDDAEVCPKCGAFQMAEDRAGARLRSPFLKSRVLTILVGTVLILAFLRWVL